MGDKQTLNYFEQDFFQGENPARETVPVKGMEGKKNCQRYVVYTSLPLVVNGERREHPVGLFLYREVGKLFMVLNSFLKLVFIVI